MDIPEYENTNSASVPSSHPSPLVSRFAIPFAVLFLLFSMNVFFWFDYSIRKYKTALIRQDVKVLLSATEEEQKIGLWESKQKLSVFEAENSALLSDLASSTNMLASAESGWLNHDQDMALIASTTAVENEKGAALSREIAEIKNIMLPL